MEHLNDHGQPLNRAFNASRLAERGADELIGITKGIMADGMIMDAEAKFLLDWMESNSSIIYNWPYNVLYARIHDALSDGKLDLEEQRELLDLLHDFTGGMIDEDKYLNKSTRLPLDNPPPVMVFPSKNFCFTGRFNYGTRNECCLATQQLGGLIVDGIRQDLNFLVVGEFGSTDWIHSTHGRKIEKAVEYREKGFSLAIVSEECWFNNMKAQILNKD